ncbi:MAG TPA: serpin family protein [Bacteroidales bacterium]|nr:serpin family protein [Bacteroidales bacterium]
MKSIIKERLFVAFVSSVVILTSCEKKDTIEQSGDPVNITTEVYQKEVIDSANRFAFDLFKPILTDAKGTENIMISPFSITSALSMTLNGAAGETFEAMRKTLGLEQKTLEQINNTYLKLMTEMVPVDKRVVMEIANSVWVEKRLIVKQPFITDLKTWYIAEARDIDVTNPNAVDIVNGWIAEKTHDKITEMLDNLNPDLAMLLINAVYFNGKWRYQFDKADTKEEPFYVTPSASKTVPMMHQTENLKAVRHNNLTIVEIPYGQGNYTMVVVLPDENVTTSDVANALNPSMWQEWMGLLAENTHQVDLSIPRFKHMYKRLLNDDLKGLGMGIAFTDQANFSNISDQGLMISRVLHQTFIETNEEGTEAAAATVVEIGLSSAGLNVTTITLDHPFLYFIRESSTGTILFMGRVSDPAIN